MVVAEDVGGCGGLSCWQRLSLARHRRKQTIDSLNIAVDRRSFFKI